MCICEALHGRLTVYVGGSFNQIDGGNNMVIGVATDNTLIIAAITSVVNESKLPVTVSMKLILHQNNDT